MRPESEVPAAAPCFDFPRRSYGYLSPETSLMLASAKGICTPLIIDFLRRCDYSSGYVPNVQSWLRFEHAL